MIELFNGAVLTNELARALHNYIADPSRRNILAI